LTPSFFYSCGSTHKHIEGEVGRLILQFLTSPVLLSLN
jgi:hypothetical protein